MRNETALVTGVGKKAGIGTAIAERLREDGWNVVTTYWSDYDRRMPWGKGALDRITLAAARELGHLGITADAVNPGATDTGWISESLREAIKQHTPLCRVGTPQDCAGLVAFLCGPEGGWVNGQVLVANGGAA